MTSGGPANRDYSLKTVITVGKPTTKVSAAIIAENFKLGVAEMSDEAVLGLLKEVKALAKRYRALTGKPLGITGEVAEYEAARLLGLELAVARQSGYDALENTGNGVRRLQVKGRCLAAKPKPGQRMGAIDIHKDWDAVLLVLLNEDLEAIQIWEADREPIIAALLEPGSKSRNERFALGINKFKSIGRCRWPLRNA